MDWNSIGSAEDYSWAIKPNAWAKLMRIVGALPDGIEHQRPHVCNRNVRSFLLPHLRSDSRSQVCDWIVKDWGGIRGGSSKKFEKIVAAFGNFSEIAVARAASELSFDRISSWSKLAAFAYPEMYAIYNSRTAGALNRLLPAGANFFFVPPSQGKEKNALRRKGHATKKKSLTYADYLNLLNDGRQGDRSLLDIEMALFANSDRICGVA